MDTPPKDIPEDLTVCAHAKAITDFSSHPYFDNNQNSTLLNLEEDDILGITSSSPVNGWLYGENLGVWGWFPSECVEIVKEEDKISEVGTSNIVEDARTLETRDAPKLRSWYKKYVKVTRYEKKTSTISANPDDKNSSSTSVDVEKPQPQSSNESVVSRENTLTHEATIKDKSRENTLTHEATIKDKSEAKPGKFASKSTVTAGKVVVNVFGAPAEERPRWIDFAGGHEAVANMGINKMEIKKQEVIYEFVCTELDYVEDLSIIVDLYINPMRKNKLIRPKDLAVLFSNIEQVLPINKEFSKWLDDLHNDGPIVQLIGELLIKVSDYLKIYTMYCSNHPYALMKLQALQNGNKSIAKFFEQCAASQQSRNLSLANFLIKPVQRICKYPLLIRELIRSTDASHPDYQNLCTALLKVETVVTIVNEAARQAEGVHKMLDFQNRLTTKCNLMTPQRQLIQTGTLSLKIGGNELKKKRSLSF